MQLPFAVIPLMMFASDKARMGAFGAPRWQVVTGWVIAAVIVALNVKVLLNVALGAEGAQATPAMVTRPARRLF